MEKDRLFNGRSGVNEDLYREDEPQSFSLPFEGGLDLQGQNGGHSISASLECQVPDNKESL